MLAFSTLFSPVVLNQPLCTACSALYACMNSPTSSCTLLGYVYDIWGLGCRFKSFPRDQLGLTSKVLIILHQEHNAS